MNSTLQVREKIINDKTRFVIVNNRGDVINDANGYGFRTKETASKTLKENYKNKLKYNPLRTLVLGLIKKDKEFINEGQDSLQTEFWYNFKDYNRDADAMKEADKEAIDNFIGSLSEHFEINLWSDIKKTNSSIGDFLDLLDELT